MQLPAAPRPVAAAIAPATADGSSPDACQLMPRPWTLGAGATEILAGAEAA